MTEHSPEGWVKPNQADFSAEAGKDQRCEETPHAVVLTSSGVQRNSELKEPYPASPGWDGCASEIDQADDKQINSGVMTGDLQ